MLRVHPRSVASRLPMPAGALALPVVVTGAATVIGVVLNFAFNLLAARSLGPADYGLLAALVGLAGVIGTAFGSLQVVTAREVAVLAPTTTRRTVDPWTVQALAIGGAVAVLMALAGPVLATLLRTDLPLVLVLALGCPPAALLAVMVGRLIGQTRIITWQVVGLLATVVKVLLGLVAVGLGLGVLPFALALPVGGLLIGLLAAGLTRGVRVPRQRLAGWPVWGSTLVVLFLWSATQADVILARVRLSETEAGLYAAAAIIGKAIPMVAGLLGTALLPLLARRLRAGRSSAHLTAVVAGGAGLFGVGCALAVSVIGPLLMTTFYGETFTGAGPLLIGLAWAAVPWCVAVAVINLKLAGHHFVWLAVTLGGVLVAEVLVLALTARTAGHLLLGTAAFGVAAAVCAITAPVSSGNGTPPMTIGPSVDPATLR